MHTSIHCRHRHRQGRPIRRLPPLTPTAFPQELEIRHPHRLQRPPLVAETLLDLLDDHAVVAAEPTGHHLLAPIANLLHAYKPAAQLWQVDGKQTAHYRDSFIAAKNDRLDAIALTLIARDIAAGTRPATAAPTTTSSKAPCSASGCWSTSHRRLTKENTRTKNR